MELRHGVLLGVKTSKARVARTCTGHVLSLEARRVQSCLALEEALHRGVVIQRLVVLLLFGEA